MDMPDKKLGFGMMRIPGNLEGENAWIDYDAVSEMVDTYLEHGFHYFDTAFMYCKGLSEEAVRRSLTSRHGREEYYLTDKASPHMLEKPEDMERKFYEQLEKCGVTYFDNYLAHNMNVFNYKRASEWKTFEFMQRLKEQGLVKHIGFSFHDQPQLLDQILTEHPEAEYVQIQLNYNDWNNPAIRSRECYETIVRHGKKVLVMEPLKGGTLANVPEDVNALFKSVHPDMSAASWGIRFAASLPEVVMVLSGMSNREQMMDNISYMEDFKPLNEEEYKVIDRALELINQAIAIPCTACRYCTDGCPKHIAIPEYFALYNADGKNGNGANIHGVYYRNHAKDHGKASDCIGCRKCERSCPQHLEITRLLKQVAERFES